MPDFKIEDNISLDDYADPSEELDRPVISTDDEEDDEEDDEDPEIPGKRGRKPRCKHPDLHRWRPWQDREKCELCGDVFPCMNEAKCWHVDCWEERGKIHPWILCGTMAPKTHGFHKGLCLYCRAPESDLEPCRGLPWVDDGEQQTASGDDSGNRGTESAQEIPGQVLLDDQTGARSEGVLRGYPDQGSNTGDAPGSDQVDH